MPDHTEMPKPGLRAAQFSKCVCCGKGVGSSIYFYRATIEHHVLNTRAIQRQHGLEQMVGNAAIAAVMGPDDHLSAVVSSRTVLICAECSMATLHLAGMAYE